MAGNGACDEPSSDGSAGDEARPVLLAAGALLALGAGAGTAGGAGGWTAGCGWTAGAASLCGTLLAGAVSTGPPLVLLVKSR